MNTLVAALVVVFAIGMLFTYKRPGDFVFVVIAIGMMFLIRFFTKPRPGDFESIRDFVASRGRQVVSITKHNNYCRYWLRGNIRLSNVARLYLVIAQSSDGSRHEIHTAIDQWPGASGKLQVLLERAVEQ